MSQKGYVTLPNCVDRQANPKVRFYYTRKAIFLRKKIKLSMEKKDWWVEAIFLYFLTKLEPHSNMILSPTRVFTSPKFHFVSRRKLNFENLVRYFCFTKTCTLKRFRKFLIFIKKLRIYSFNNNQLIVTKRICHLTQLCWWAGYSQCTCWLCQKSHIF